MIDALLLQNRCFEEVTTDPLSLVAVTRGEQVTGWVHLGEWMTAPVVAVLTEYHDERGNFHGRVLVEVDGLRVGGACFQELDQKRMLTAVYLFPHVRRTTVSQALGELLHQDLGVMYALGPFTEAGKRWCLTHHMKLLGGLSQDGMGNSPGEIPA